MSFGRRRKKEPDPLAAYRKVRQPTPDVVDTVFDHETRAADLFGGERHRGSGAMPFLKSDASSARYQIECKQTVKESISLKLDWLKKITFEAFGKSKVPVLHVHFLRDMPGVERDWVLLPASEVEKLLEGRK